MKHSLSDSIRKLSDAINGAFDSGSYTSSGFGQKVISFFNGLLSFVRDMLLFILLATIGCIVVYGVYHLFTAGVSLYTVLDVIILYTSALMLAVVYKLV